MALPVPDDTLADILRRLPSRSLPAARCVCKLWRTLVDGRALLLPCLLPHSVYGVLINYIDYDRPHLFSRLRYQSTTSAASSGSGDIDGNLSSVTKGNMDWWHVMDHCDGLLLCAVEWGRRLCVGNPTTRRWARLPPCPESPEPIRYSTGGAYLAFDPAATSPHYEVFLIPGLPEKLLPPAVKPKAKAIAAPFCLDELLASLDSASWTMEKVEPEPEPVPPLPLSSIGDDDLYCLMEWPPSPYMVMQQW